MYNLIKEKINTYKSKNHLMYETGRKLGELNPEVVRLNELMAEKVKKIINLLGLRK